MFFMQKSNIIFRNYKSFGYITDNRNFGYKQTDDNNNYIGDKIISESGAVFFSVLDRKPQALDELTKKILLHFTNVDIQTIENDAKEFYCMLERDGFIVSGKTLQTCYKKDTRFSYKRVEPEKKRKENSPNTVNSEISSQEFFEKYLNNKPQLTNLHIEITSRCNERCVHCYIPHENKDSDMDPDVFYNILEQSKNMRLLHLTLSGGEPLLHKNFCNFLKKCREYNFSVNVLSNLTLLNDEIIKEMKTNPLLGVQVSLYSMNPEIHDEITHMNGSFIKTTNAILRLIENDIPMQISCPIMKQNKDCYYEVVEWAKEHKINVGDDYVIIARYDHITQNLCSRLSINEIEEVIREIVANDTKYLEQIENEAVKKKSITLNDYVCSVCHASICIADNGNVYPCAGWQDYTVGNVKKTSLQEIWDNSEKVQYLRDLRGKDFPGCIQCSEREFCTMCMVRNANENPMGNPLAVNEYFCKIAKLNKKILLEWKRKHMNGFNCI